MTRVYLLRHGATAANLFVPYKLQGRGSDLPLNETGRFQAEAAARTLSAIPLAAVYSSPLLRAVQTALSLSRNLRPIAVEELIEGDVGRWEGLTWDEAKEQDPEHHGRFFQDPGETPYPDGESFLDVQRRVTPAVLRLASQHPNESIAIVGHNILNRAYLATLLGLPISKAREIRQANGGINVIDIDDQGRSIVQTINSAIHLEGLADHLGRPG